MATARGNAPLQGGREVAEWLFVPSVFESVLLQDRTAHGVSSRSLRTDRIRAVAVGIVGVLGLAVAAALTTSYGCNRSLEKDLVSAARALTDHSGKISPIRRLEQIRQPVQRLVAYRSHTPLSMTWGLYPGNELLPSAQATYCAAMHSEVLQPLIRKMTNDLAAVGTAGTDPSSAFNVLKAYMMMTTHPQYADETFLADQLYQTWKGTPSVAAAPEAVQLLPEELRLYGRLLSVPDAQAACLFPNAPGVIPAVQEYCAATRTINTNRCLRPRARDSRR